MNNKTNAFIVSCLSTLGLLLSSQLAHADFRKAVDAYVARDGVTMLAEVKHAANMKQEAGLMLFLSALQIDAYSSAQNDISRVWAGDRAKHYVDPTQFKTTLSTILTDSQQDDLFNTLQMAVNNSSADVQYELYSLKSVLKKSQQNLIELREELSRKGSYKAGLMSARGILKYAEMGDFLSQLRLGLMYLNFRNGYLGYGCEENNEASEICRNKDEEKGYYWLKQALKGYERIRYINFFGEDVDTFGAYADAMCDFFHQTADGDKNKLRQAYLWCVVGINSGGLSSWRLLDLMDKAGNLRIAAPETAKIWGMSIKQDKERLYKTLSLINFKELPDWMIEVENELPKKELPVFSYYFNDYRLPTYLLDVYADGRVNIAFTLLPDGKSDELIKVSPTAVRSFLKDLEKTGFRNWSLFTTAGQFCDSPDPCIWTHVQVIHREGNRLRKVKIREPAYLAEHEYDNASTLRVAKLNALVGKYFPTREIRCELGASEGYRQACIERDKRWSVLANREFKK